jgi:hypothetical protein
MRPIGGQLVKEELHAIRQREFAYRQKRERDECPPSQNASGSAPGASGTSTGLTIAERAPWLERTGWEETYRGADLFILSMLVLPPGSWSGRVDADLCLGHQHVEGQREDIISPAGDEKKIQVLLNLFDQLMDRCEATAKQTSRNIRCWLRST